MVPATTDSFVPADLCDSPAMDTGFVPPGALNRAVVPVVPGTTYYYRVEAPPEMSAEFSFTAPVGPGLLPPGSLQLVVVPEPGAFALAGLGIAAAWALRRRRRASVAGQR